MKKIKLTFIIFFILFAFTAILSLNEIYGISSSISSGNVLQGNQITVKVNFSSDICAANFALSYDQTKLELIRGDLNYAWAEGENLPTYTFKAKSNVTGNASISLSGEASDTNYNKHPLTGSGNINITAQQVQPSPPPENTNKNNNTTNTNVPTNTNTQTNTAKNNNAYLSKLQANQEGLTPNFNKTKTNYSITVGENVDSLKVTATPEASTSKVSVTGNTNLKNGDNKIYITVTAQDGTKKVYTITVTKTADAVKSNSYLQNLIVENATLSPEFSKEVFEYDCGTVGASVENLKILAFGENENVKVEITGNDKLVDGENTITVKVTSEDGTTTKEYVIKVKKDSSLVEENDIQEINSLQDTNNDNKIVTFFKNLWSKIKENWLLVLMYIFIIIEFFEIVYLYRHQERKIKKDSNKEELKKTTEKNMTLDKEFKQNKKLKRNLDDNEKINDINKRRNGRQKFDNKD